jgi:arsenate reductase
MNRPLRILFLCTGNSCRSQMAEGFARALRGEAIEAHSAGVDPHGMNPRAVRAMAEAGVDISAQRSKHIDEYGSVALDAVVTVCGHAGESCPAWLRDATPVVHVGFDDPPKLAADATDDEDAMRHYRRVRDEIREWVLTLPGSLPPPIGGRRG